MSRRAHHGAFHDLGGLRPAGAPARPVVAFVPATLRDDAPPPVLILLDGQNVFGDHGSFAGGWHAHEAVDRLRQRTVRAPIVVGVANGGMHRVHELGRDVHGFLGAIVDRVLPRVARKFGPYGRVVIGGASLGGLASLVAWFRFSAVFDGAIAMSPSLWFGHAAVRHHIETGDWPIPARGRLYVDAGGRERGHMFADAEQLSRWLVHHGLPRDRLMWRPDKKGTHHERHWRRRLPKALRFAFAAAGDP